MGGGGCCVASGCVCDSIEDLCHSLDIFCVSFVSSFVTVRYACHIVSSDRKPECSIWTPLVSLPWVEKKCLVNKFTKFYRYHLELQI